MELIQCKRRALRENGVFSTSPYEALDDVADEFVQTCLGRPDFVQLTCERCRHEWGELFVVKSEPSSDYQI
jgi:hypothetical protein